VSSASRCATTGQAGYRVAGPCEGVVKFTGGEESDIARSEKPGD